MPPETHDSSVGLFPLGAVGELPAASGIPWLSARIEIQSNPIHTGLRWRLTVCPTHLFTHPKSRLMFCTSFIEGIGLIPDLIANLVVYSSPLFRMYCVWMLASCRNNGSGGGGHGRVAAAYTGSECVFLPVSLENLCLYRGGIQEKDCLSGMLIWKTAFLATPGLSHICCICCHFTLSFVRRKRIENMFDGPRFTSAAVC